MQWCASLTLSTYIPVRFSCPCHDGAVGIHAGYGGISGANLAASLQRQVGQRGTLEVYVSLGLAVTRVIGPATDLAASWTRNGDTHSGAAAGPKRAKRGGGCAAVALRAVERGTAVAFHLDVLKPLDTQAYVQVEAPMLCPPKCLSDLQ